MPAQCSNHGRASARAAAGPSVSSRSGAGTCETGSASRVSRVRAPPIEKRSCVVAVVVAVAQGRLSSCPNETSWSGSSKVRSNPASGYAPANSVSAAGRKVKRPAFWSLENVPGFSCSRSPHTRWAVIFTATAGPSVTKTAN